MTLLRTEISMSEKDKQENGNEERDPRKEALEDLRFLIETIVAALVEYPDQVKIVELAGFRNVVLEVTVAESDVGAVVGSNARTVEAIRTILYAACKRYDLKYNLDVAGSSSPSRTGRKRDSDDDR